jgi:hypothetical protein
LSYEKKRHDQVNKTSGKKERKNVNAALRKEKRELAKLHSKAEKASKKAKQGEETRSDHGSDDE